MTTYPTAGRTPSTPDHPLSSPHRRLLLQVARAASACLGLAALTAAADEPIPASAPAAASLTAPDVNAWLDGYLPYALATGVRFSTSEKP